MAHGTSNGLSNGNGGPWWMRFAERFGLAAVFAMVLLWFLVGKLWAEVQASREDHQGLRYYLVGVCVNTAKDDTQRAYCLQEPRR